MADELGDDPDQSDESDNQDERTRCRRAPGNQPTAKTRKASSPPTEELQRLRRRHRSLRNGGRARRTRTRRPTTWKARNSRDGDEPGGRQPALLVASPNREFLSRSFTNQFDEEIARRGSLRRRGADPAARLSRQAALQPAGRRRPARQPPAAPPDGAAEPLLGVRSRGRRARSRAAGARRHRSRCIRCPSRRRRTPNSATPW